MQWVNRTTNGFGLVSEMTYQEIQALDAGSWFGPQFQVPIDEVNKIYIQLG
jgi:glycerophosphoryl diester phosphodiesterase